MENKRWYAVMTDRDDSDWGFGSYDLEEAKDMLAGFGTDDGYIAVIENDVCVQELEYEELYEKNLVVIDRAGCDEWSDVVENEEEADRMWDRLTDHDKRDRDYFYLCTAYTYNGNVVSEISEIKRYK